MNNLDTASAAIRNETVFDDQDLVSTAATEQYARHFQGESARANLNSGSSEDRARNSWLYREFQAEREEILKHKWIESEKAGRDIGFERALVDWIRKERKKWRQTRPRRPVATTEPLESAGRASLVPQTS
jgi:hypothetical protein